MIKSMMVLLTALALSASVSITAAFAGTIQASTKVAAAIIEKNAGNPDFVILDVRPAQMYRQGHIKRAVSMPVGCCFGVVPMKKHVALLDIYQIMLNCRFMESKQASKIFEALSSDVRLDLFRLLVKNAPEGLVAGDIAKQLNIPSTNLSFHLKAIVQSGLVNVEREGRFMRYKASIPLMLDIVAYLTSECCSGDPDQCQKFRDASAVGPDILPKRYASEV